MLKTFFCSGYRRVRCAATISHPLKAGRLLSSSSLSLWLLWKYYRDCHNNCHHDSFENIIITYIFLISLLVDRQIKTTNGWLLDQNHHSKWYHCHNYNVHHNHYDCQLFHFHHFLNSLQSCLRSPWQIRVILNEFSAVLQKEMFHLHFSFKTIFSEISSSASKEVIFSFCQM